MIRRLRELLCSKVAADRLITDHGATWRSAAVIKKFENIVRSRVSGSPVIHLLVNMNAARMGYHVLTRLTHPEVDLKSFRVHSLARHLRSLHQHLWPLYSIDHEDQIGRASCRER